MKHKMITVPKVLIASILVTLGVVASFLGTLMKTAPVANPVLGAIPGNEVQGNDFIIGGLLTRNVQVTMQTGSTTPCAIQAPSATSTLIYSSATVTTASTTAYKIDIAKANTAFATTTSLGSNAYSAGVKGTLIATRPSAGVDDITTFAPNQWLVVGLEGKVGAGGGGGVMLGDNTRGTCQAMFVQDN